MELGRFQLKCSVYRINCYKRDACHGSYPDFLPSFFPTVFSVCRFFSGLLSDSFLCELLLSSVLRFLLFIYHMFKCNRSCSITYCYSSCCLAENCWNTANLFSFYCSGGLLQTLGLPAGRWHNQSLAVDGGVIFPLRLQTLRSHGVKKLLTRGSICIEQLS